MFFILAIKPFVKISFLKITVINSRTKPDINQIYNALYLGVQAVLPEYLVLPVNFTSLLTNQHCLFTNSEIL